MSSYFAIIRITSIGSEFDPLNSVAQGYYPVLPDENAE
jgi:hypothetical protein